MAAIEAFGELDLRVGRIVSAQPFPEARKPAYRLEIDFGSLGLLRSSAQITQLYDVGELPGRLVVAVVNLPPRRIAGFVSDVLVLGAPDHEGRVVLLEPERVVPPGSRVY